MAKGGMRFGAGRPAHRLQEGHTRSIDVRRWQRDGLLREGGFGWHWKDADTGELKSSIGVSVQPFRVVLSYTSGQRTFDTPIRITHTACNYGGSRPWFNCPGCHRRCAKLFLRWGLFQCRVCSQIAYRSQCEDTIGRLWLAQSKVEAKLGPHGQRPKHMKQATFERLRERKWELEVQREDAFCDAVARMGFLLALGTPGGR
jgi:hypothetical protein